MIMNIKEHLLFYIFAIGIAISSSGCLAQKTDNTEKSGNSSIESQNIDNNIWKEVKGRQVSFVRMHPRAAQKNSYLTWQLFKHATDGSEQWRVDGKALSPEGVADLTALLDEVAKVEAPSNGIYGCRETELMPQYRLSFERDGHAYRVVSVSNCANGAPFNVIVDGAYRIDLAGAIGAKLEKALKTAGLALEVGGTPGMITLDAPTTLAGYEAQAQASPIESFDKVARSDAEFSSFYDKITELFDAPPEKQLACNQAKSADCSILDARYVFKSAKMRYPIRMNMEAGEIDLEFPLPSADDIASLRTFIEAPLFEQYAATGDGVVSVLYQNVPQCSFVRDLAPFMDRQGDVSCAQWILGGKPRPSAIYYVGLSTLWIAPANSESFLSVVCKWKHLPKQAKSIACAQPVLPESLNVFWRGDGSVYGFETRDGKTKLLK